MAGAIARIRRGLAQSRLRPALLAVWNRGHQWFWASAELLDALVHRRWERCSVCGRVRPMLLRRRVVPTGLVDRWNLTPELAEALRRKESLDCAGCGAKLRARRLAKVLLEILPSSNATSLRAWSTTARARGLRIAEINRIDGLHESLAGLPGFVASDFVENARPGEVVRGVRHEDLMGLTFADESLDLVLTSETLEHVPDLDQALREIHRVLAPGGLHACTVPKLPDTPRTFARARLGAGGELELLAPSIRHPGGDVGYLVFTEFGADWPALASKQGFRVEEYFGPTCVTDLAQVVVMHKHKAEVTGSSPGSTQSP